MCQAPLRLHRDADDQLSMQTMTYLGLLEKAKGGASKHQDKDQKEDEDEDQHCNATAGIGVCKR